MGTTAEKLTYLNETKTQLKDMLNLGGTSLTTEPFRQYVDTLKNRYLYFMNNGTQQVWDNWGKVVGEGTTITLNNTEEAPMEIDLKGNTLQNGTPTPTTPIPVQVVSGDNSIDICGKNLFGTALKTANSGTSNYTLITDTSDKLEIQGVGGYYSGIYKKYRLQPSTTYTISLRYSEKGQNTGNNIYYKLGNECEQINISNANGNKTVQTTTTSLSFTTDSTGLVAILFTCNWATNTGYIVYNDIQLEKGSTATTYEAYTGESYPISLGVENLLDNIATTQTISGITFTKNNDGTMLVNGTASADVSLKITNYLTFPSGNYILSGCPSGGSNATYSMVLEGTGRDTGNSVSFTSATNKRVAIEVKNGTTCNNLLFKPMIEKGTKLNSYTPYGTTPIELCKIGDYQDRIYKDSGKWYVKKEIGKVVLDGSENWGKSSSTANTLFYLSNTTPYKNGTTSSSTDLYCNYFEGKIVWGNNVIGCELYVTNSIRFGLTTSSTITTLEQWKTWLASNNVIVYYVLATPTYTEITDSTLLSQLNALAKSYASQTNISQENNDLASILNATALEEMS